MRDNFWEVASLAEKNLVYKELFERITIKENQLDIEIKTAGARKIMEGIILNGNV